MGDEIQERIDLLENSIKFLEAILKNYTIKKESKPVNLIQDRIRSYRSELQIRRDYRFFSLNWVKMLKISMLALKLFFIFKCENY